ncbi:hypothetical protein E2C01_081193 [Portunus trituberculatus]|uniref:Uncharacterized protein n=1 Tax=Portunus trituberculatus TaxID=210409 RepID=A0A5B7J0F6_PORTR|nr:hypothetical protein [Portunus trituberculatus]
MLPSPPRLSFSHCQLTTHVITNSGSRDASGIKFPHSASTRVPQSYIAAPLRARRRRAIGTLNVTLEGAEERRPSSEREAVIDTYRRKKNGTARRIRTFVFGKKKDTSATRVILAGNHENGESTGVHVAQSGHLAYSSIKTSETAPSGSLHKGECVARCPPHNHHHHHHQECRHQHVKGFMDTKKIRHSSFLNSLLGTKHVKFLPRSERGVLLEGGSGSRVPFSPPRNTQHPSKATDASSGGGRGPGDATHKRAEEPPSLFKTGGNKTLPSACRYDTDTEETQRARRRRQAMEDVTSSLETDTNLQTLPQTSENVDFDNATSLVTSLINSTLKEEEGLQEAMTEQSREAQGGEGEGAASHAPEVLVHQPGEVRDSCHCELSHLTCQGTHLRNISARIVGEMKQL